jgi:HK97 family phage portal protein
MGLVSTLKSLLNVFSSPRPVSGRGAGGEGLHASNGRSSESRAINGIGSLTPDARYITGDINDLGTSDDTPSANRVAGYPPVSQAIQMIAGDCAKLPARVFQTYSTADGIDRYHRPKHYASRLIDLFGQPNDTDTTFDVLYDWFFDALLFGGGYLWVDRVGPKPVGIYKLLPDRTRPFTYGGKRYFQTHFHNEATNSYTPVYYANEDILFLQGPNVASMAPSNPIRLYQDTFNQAINAADFTSAYFRKGTQAGGLLMTPPGASSTAIDNVEKQIIERTKKENWFKTLMIKDGFKWQSTTGSLRDATAVELDESTARHVARIYNLPPSKLGIKDSSSYNSLEQDNQQYYDSCLSTWLIQARSQMHRKLIIPSEQPDYVIDYEIDLLQWADSQARANVMLQFIDRGVMDAAEVRRKYGMPPKPSHDN